MTKRNWLETAFGVVSGGFLCMGSSYINSRISWFKRLLGGGKFHWMHGLMGGRIVSVADGKGCAAG